jgi:hypothetical protein
MLFLNIFEAKNVGIIYDATDTESFETVKSFTKQLSDRHIKLNVLDMSTARSFPSNFFIVKGLISSAERTLTGISGLFHRLLINS